MLPSTGYFKTIICPFYENGCCDRPYCHFKHLRRDITNRSKVTQSIKDDSTSSSASLPACPVQTPEASQKIESPAVDPATGNKAEIHHLVNEAMKKLLETQDVDDTKAMTDKIVAQVVEQLKPSISPNSLPGYSSVSTEKIVPPSTIGKHTGVPGCVTKPSTCVYNPTPISELKKRHIPVPVYMPTRESRVAAKRKSSSDPIAKPWLGMLRESTNSHVSEMTYKPTAIVNTSQEQEKTSKSYVPTLRSDNSSSNSHDDANSNDYVGKVKEAYYPKSKKRREEYVPKKVKKPLKSVHQLDDTVLDEFEPEFNIIDEILTSSSATIITEDQTIVIDENSDDTYEIEAKFSEDEEDDAEEDDAEENEAEEDDAEELLTDSTSTKEVQRDNVKPEDEALDDGKENESNEVTKKEVNNSIKKKSRKSSTSHRAHGNDEKSSNSSASRSKDKSSRKDSMVDSIENTGMVKDKKKERRDSSRSDGKKDEAEGRKKEHKSSGKNHEKSKKDGNDKNACKDKHRHNDSSSTRDKSRSASSNKDKDRSKDSHSNDVKRLSSHRSKDTVKSRKDKVPSSKSDDGKTREKSRHDSKHSTSSSKTKKSIKNQSHKSTEKKLSSRSGSHKTSKSSEKKSHSRKESSSETSFVEHDDRSNSPFGSNFINEESMETSDSDHDVEEECLKIFQEYEPSEHPKGVTTREAPKNEPEDKEDVGRRRVAHPSAAESIVRAHGPSRPAKKLRDPHQRMYDRWRSMKEAADKKAAERRAAGATKPAIPVEAEKSSQSQQITSEQEEIRINPGNTMSKAAACDAQVNGNGKIRIAHVPYAMALAMKKKKVTESKAAMEARAFAALEAKTAAQTSKGSRVAHIPQVVPELAAPEPLQVATQKFPITVRQYYVNLMHVICVQIYTNGEDAAQRALREELACHDRCKALTVYKNSCMLANHRLRKEAEQGMNGDDALPSASGIVSHNAVLAGKSKGSWSVEKTKKSIMDYRGVALYERLKKWIASEQQLRDNGFPRSHPEGPKGHAKVYSPNTRNQSIISKVPNERYCCRCNKPYMVNKHGLPVQQQNCIYHWGRKFTTRGESKYMCCQQYGFASGCADAKNHVWDYVDYDNLRGYVKTLPKDLPAEEQGVYALDCEMSYTTQGLELTRVTVINDNCNTIYETLVMPENPILDYNTRFSGITEENMKGVTTTLLDVQATLLTMFSEKTILVGHSLESDFKALKLIHDTIVDTSMMFPHKNGPPQKRALRNLCSEYLRKIIQNEVGGHDSAEDAVACMDLVHWKVKEEAKLQ